MKILRLCIELNINYSYSLNRIYSGIHWAKRKKQKDTIRFLVKKALKNRSFKFYTPVEITMAFNSKLDVSNHAYLFKMIEDGLVKEGVLQDDSFKFVKGIMMTKQSEFKGVIVEVKERNG